MSDRCFYVCCGEGRYRTWGDWVRYGFVSGGQGRWYSRTLELLFPGAMVFAYIPKNGYVGVGTVTEPARPVVEFTVSVDGRSVPILGAPELEAPDMGLNAGDPERCEYLARVSWERVCAREDAAIWPGAFANQNTVCRLRHEETLEHLAQAFGLPAGCARDAV